MSPPDSTQALPPAPQRQDSLWLQAVQLVWEHALERDDSILTPGWVVWTPANLDTTAQILDTISPSSTFAASLHAATRDTPAPVAQLMAEALLVQALFPGATTHATLLLAQSLLRTLPEPVTLSDDLRTAVYAAGKGSLLQRISHLRFLIETARQWKKLPASTRIQLRHDPWALRDWLFQLPNQRAQSQREALLYILHPQTFEPIASHERKQALARTLLTAPSGDADRDLFTLRTELEAASKPRRRTRPRFLEEEKALYQNGMLAHTNANVPLGQLLLLPTEQLEQRISELQRNILIDRSVIVRIYRALLAGQHVILSGPPGTGKTRIARLLPDVLWREEYAEQPRSGYATITATATEEWGPRQLFGSIAPQVHASDSGGRIVYRVQPGALTQALLANYAPQSEQRTHWHAADGKTYRGCWLVIDELTRAPADTMLAGLLSLLGGGADQRISLPFDDGEHEVPIPRDFRIIATINAFDRHFVHQMSEALKRRFSFIEIEPPVRAQAQAELDIALFHALADLAEQGIPSLRADRQTGYAIWDGVGSVEFNTSPQISRYVAQIQLPAARAALESLCRCFAISRLYRPLGTAQVQSACAALCAGALVGMDWHEALDSALADTLANQLHILSTDERAAILAFISAADQPEHFSRLLQAILEQSSHARASAHLSLLRRQASELAVLPPGIASKAALNSTWLAPLFLLGAPSGLNIDGLFARRLRLWDDPSER